MVFAPATREKSKLRMAIMGPAKSGKTYTSLKLATELVAPDGKIAFIDTENGSAAKYAGPGGFKFDVLNLTNHHPNEFVEAIREAYRAGYQCVIVDSLSHEWMGKGGCLELVDEISSHSKSGNTFTPWKEVTPLHREVFEVINKAPMHIICTFRVKTEYAMRSEESNGRTRVKPERIGLGPITRDGAEYEFDILMDMDKGCGYIDHTSRCGALQYLVVQHPGAELASVIKSWLNGEEVPLSAPVKEEKMTKVNQSPKPDAQKADPRPGVPTETAAKGKSAKDVTGSKSAAVAQTAENSGPQDPGKNSASAKETEPPKQEPAKSEHAADTAASKAVGQPAAANASATNSQASATSGEFVGKDQMGQLLEVGKKAGWQRKDLSEFLSSAFDLSKFTWKQWDVAMRLLAQVQNANGKIVVNKDGVELPEEHKWPKAVK